VTTRHTISRADTLFSGGAYYPPANSVPGLPVDVFNYFNFGGVAPAAAAANNVCASQSSSGGTNALAINGALASSGVATTDFARNLVAAWTNTAIMTVTGTDYYGQTQTEVSASGTSFTGKKAFKTVTAVTFNAAVTGATVGTGVKFGMPHRIDINGMLDVVMDNAPDATYTFVAADTTSPATSSTGDVRGTIVFATAPNGTHKYAVQYIIADRTGGVGKQVGAYGVTPA
jgi:hypothetical protein